ncbi:hypothetical protein GOZ78_19475 [Agrobacterium vitis]|uniref:hypothetical protein n=1 Tax=Agrobacterium vitis TaxID=373 RepID=UPI0012E7B567|nr:hypothetical protein [Agrobacterium vitis]MVA12197.1 hypothetical protein [Agrobacterium vitis]
MLDHYRIAPEHRMTTVRDGLVPGHHVVERLAAARRAGVEAIWDLSHYHRNQDPVRCACSTPRNRWSHGLIRKDLSVDPWLSAELGRVAMSDAA